MNDTIKAKVRLRVRINMLATAVNPNHELIAKLMAELTELEA